MNLSEFFPKQDEFTFHNLNLVFYKLKNIREIKAGSLFNIFNFGKTQNFLDKKDISKPFQSSIIEISEIEINGMLLFMSGRDEETDEIMVTNEEF